MSQKRNHKNHEASSLILLSLQLSNMQEIPHIPYDMYESSQELLIIMPLGGVKKESLSLKIEDYKLLIEGERSNPEVKENLVSIREECYRGKLHQIIDLPAQIYFEKIHSKLTPENTLQIIIPKALVPEKIVVEIEE